MGARAPRIGLTVALLAVAAVALPASADARKLRCASSGHTVVANSVARVFVIGGAHVDRYYACRLSRGKVKRIGFSTDRAPKDGMTAVRLNGRFVGLTNAYCKESGRCSGTVKVFSTSRRKFVRKGVVRDGEPAAIVMTNNGSVAWSTFHGRAEPHAVFKSDAEGSVELDSGNTIDARSLTRAGSTIYWTKGGEQKSATLE